jgi:hypothetical protein
MDVLACCSNSFYLMTKFAIALSCDRVSCTNQIVIPLSTLFDSTPHINQAQRYHGRHNPARAEAAVVGSE